jgi:hypothetical protein
VADLLVSAGFGRGLPRQDVWPAAATAVAGGGRSYGDSDIAWLLSQPIAGYLTADIEDGVIVYRWRESLSC